MKIQTLLIGLDGATFSVLDPLMARGVMPFLARFLGQGTRANLRTIVPALTPPAWTSLMTGRSPGHHGVFDFFLMDSPESRHIRFATSQDVASETIWSIASRGGLRTTVLNFPLMFPAPKLPGYVVPGWVPWRQMRLACHPSSLFDQLRELSGFNPRELAMDIKLEERATEGCSDAEEYAPWIEFHIRREQNWYAILEHLTARDASPLTAVLFDGVDKLQHLCWRFIACDPDTEWQFAWERRAHELCLEYFRNLDRLLEQCCALAGPEATVIVASDHGFGPTSRVFHINTWLEQHGYLAWSPDAASRSANTGAVLGVGQVARHTFLMDWTRTTAFATTPTSNGIYITRPSAEAAGVPAEQYSAFRSRLVDELSQVRDPATGELAIERIWTREEAFQGPLESRAPDLTLVLGDGGLVSILPGTEVFTSRPTVAGTHRPLGIFAARGPAIRQGAIVDELSILDVAPVVLHSLGQAVPENLEGRVPEELFDPDTLRHRPVQTAPAAENAPELVGVTAALDAEQEAIVMNRLRDLGYID